MLRVLHLLQIGDYVLSIVTPVLL